MNIPPDFAKMLRQVSAVQISFSVERLGRSKEGENRTCPRSETLVG